MEILIKNETPGILLLYRSIDAIHASATVLFNGCRMHDMQADKIHKERNEYERYMNTELETGKNRRKRNDHVLFSNMVERGHD